MPISQNEATRFISLIDYRIGRALGRGTVLEITYGDVDAVSGDRASAFIGGDINASTDFRIPSGLNIQSGDRVRVAIDPRGYRYIEEVLAATVYPKLEFDPVRGRILLGDGSGAPVIGTEGQVLKVGATGLLEWADDEVGLTAVPDPLTVDNLTVDVAATIEALTVAGAAGVDSPILRLSSTTDVSLASTGHALQIGDDAAANLAVDVNELMARNNGAATRLELNASGGGVGISSQISGTTAADGLLFGSDVTLYRSAADILKTDDRFVSAYLPYAVATGTVAVSISSSVGDATITLPAGTFSSTPHMLFVETNTSTSVYVCSGDATSTTSATVRVRRVDGISTGNATVRWFAFQM